MRDFVFYAEVEPDLPSPMSQNEREKFKNADQIDAKLCAVCGAEGAGGDKPRATPWVHVRTAVAP
jgi:hypothetical protein